MKRNHLCFALALAISGDLALHAQKRILPIKSPSLSSEMERESIPATRLLRPAELRQILYSPSGDKPLVLQVGSHILFAEAHIEGGEYVGAGGLDSGLQTLRDRVKGLAKDQHIVIYCGCCPWGKCPNIHPAFRQLSSLGFTHVKVLYLANNFGTDWVAAGYPVTKGR